MMSPTMQYLVNNWTAEDRARLEARCADRNVHMFDPFKPNRCAVCGCSEDDQLLRVRKGEPIKWRLPA